MSRITDIVADRPVFMVLPGKSVARLERVIQRFKERQICYVTVNNFSVLEKHILSRIHERFSIIHCHSIHGFQYRVGAIVDYLKRKDDNLMISTDIAIGTFSSLYPNLVDEFRSKLWLIPSGKWKHYNTVLALLITLMEEKVKNIIMFGNDGCNDVTAKGAKANYYRAKETWATRGTGTGITGDTGRFNDVWPAFNIEYNICSRILNCSPGSHIEHIPIIRYEDLHAYV